MTHLVHERRRRAIWLLAGAALAAPLWAHAQSVSPPGPGPRLTLASDATAADASDSGVVVIGEVVVTSRHRVEEAQKVPVALSVVAGDFLTKTNTTNIAQLSQFVPSLQFTFFNARNANINIRGLGNNIGLANDGIEPGVGFYVDGVYYDRPATATFDLIDIDKVEVLRGPQGTLFGKNTTAGAISLSTAEPTSTPEGVVEASGGNLGYGQIKAALSGPLVPGVLEGRLTFAQTTRGGLLLNLVGNKWVNAYRDKTVRAQVLYTPLADLKVRLIGDYSRQDSNCCDLVLAGIVSPPNGKSFTALSQSFGYTPYVDPFARQVDTNSTIQARQETGGVSGQADWSLPKFTITALTAWRFWNWWPANDSDYTPLSVLTRAQNGDHQRQFSQELRIASSGDNKIDYTGGLYFFHEEIAAVVLQQYGNAATAFLESPRIPALVLTGYTLNGRASYHTTSYAAFGQAVWHITPKLNFTGGLRYTYDHKDGWFNQVPSGGVPLTGPLAALIPFRSALGTADYFTVSTDKGDVSGLADLSYQVTSDVLAYATYARGDKSGGLNLTQLPAGAVPVIAPETLDHYELGLKTQMFDRRVTFNADLFWEQDSDYQANIVNAATGKQYLSNVPQVRSRGVEIDANGQPTPNLSFYASGVYDDAIYQTYPDGPCGLERITQPYCNLSGAQLAGVARWTVAFGGEYHREAFNGAEAYVGLDDNFRSSIYSAATDSIYSKLPSLNLLNARLGLRSLKGKWDAFAWVKNLTDENYFTFVSAGVGNTGALFAQLGDPRSFGATARVRF